MPDIPLTGSSIADNYKKLKRKRTAACLRNSSSSGLFANPKSAKRVRLEARAEGFGQFKAVISRGEWGVIYLTLQILALICCERETFDAITMAMGKIRETLDNVSSSGSKWIFRTFILYQAAYTSLIIDLRKNIGKAIFSLFYKRETRLEPRYRDEAEKILQHLHEQSWAIERREGIELIRTWMTVQQIRLMKMNKICRVIGSGAVHDLSILCVRFLVDPVLDMTPNFVEMNDGEWVRSLHKCGACDSTLQYLLCSSVFPYKPWYGVVSIPKLTVGRLMMDSKLKASQASGSSAVWANGGFEYEYLLDMIRGVRFADKEGLPMFETKCPESVGMVDADEEDVDVEAFDELDDEIQAQIASFYED